MQTISPDVLFNLCFHHLLIVEGGESNHPNDFGGHTKYGISKRQYPHVDIAALTVDDAKAIYYKDYWLKYKCQTLQPVAAALLFDSVVNHNPVRAIQMLQQAVRVKVDGILGPKSTWAINNTNPKALAASSLAIRATYYCELCIRNQSQRVFLLGWQRRLFSLQQFVYKHL